MSRADGEEKDWPTDFSSFSIGFILLSRNKSKGERFDNDNPKAHRTSGPKQSSDSSTWRWSHRCLGALVLALGFVNISLGVFLAVLPLPVWIIWYIYLGFLVLILVGMELVAFFRDSEKKSPSKPKTFVGKHSLLVFLFPFFLLREVEVLFVRSS